jgi:hypothetical protein
MGIFDTSRTDYYSSTYSLVEETPNLIKDSVRLAIQRNRNITQDIQDNYTNGLHTKANAVYRYAAQFYKYGLPNGTTTSFKVRNTALEAVIAQEVGFEVSVVRSELERVNSSWFAEDWLVANRQMELSTGLVRNPPFPEKGATYFIGTSMPKSLASGKYLIEYRVQSSGERYTESITDARVANSKAQWYHVEYVKVAEIPKAGGYYRLERNLSKFDWYGTDQVTVYRWYYDTTTGVHAGLNPDPRTVDISPFLPIIPIRSDQKDLSNPAHYDPEEYKQVSHMCRQMGLKFDNLADSVHGRNKGEEGWDEENDPYWVNPQVDEVDDANLLFAIHLHEDVDVVRQYVHEFCKYMFETSVYTERDFKQYLDEDAGLFHFSPPMNSVKFQDARYDMEVVYGYVTQELVNGKINPEAKIGDVELSFTQGQDLKLAFNTRSSVVTDSIISKRQITPGVYEILTVHSVWHMNYFLDEHGFKTRIMDYINAAEDKKKSTESFLLPIHINRARNLGLIRSNELYYYSIKMVMNTKVVTKLAWYEQGWFQGVIAIVAVIITIYSAGTMGALVTSALGIGAGVFVTYLLGAIANFILGALVNLVADVLGAEVAIILQIVAMAFIQSKAAAAELTKTLSAEGLTAAMRQAAIDATEITFANVATLGNITKILEVAQRGYFESEMETLQNEMDSLSELNMELEEDWAELVPNLDPMESFMTVYLNQPNSTVDAYYQRTIHTPNPGLLSLTFIENWVEQALKLQVPESNIKLDLKG